MFARGGFLRFSLKEGNTSSSSLLYGVSRRQLSRCAASRGCSGTGRFDAFDLGLPNLP